MNDKHPSVRLEPSVSEEWIRRVIQAGISPTAFASWLLAEADLDKQLEAFGLGKDRSPSPAAEAAQKERGALVPPRGRVESRSSYLPVKGWSKESFFRYLDLVSKIDTMTTSMCLLGAYLKLGPVPTSERLQALCGFHEESEWQQELRVAKQRLTLEARRLNSPPLFPRAKTGTQGERLHPIERSLWGWLKEWGEKVSEDRSAVAAFPEPASWGGKNLELGTDTGGDND